MTGEMNRAAEYLKREVDFYVGFMMNNPNLYVDFTFADFIEEFKEDLAAKESEDE